MLLDMRIYLIKPNGMAEHLDLYDRYGKVPQCRHLGLPVAVMTTETGPLNQYVHIWGYEDAADREARRAAMWRDAEWLDYVERVKVLDVLISQETRLLTSVGFFAPNRATMI
jgi:hypothetical protein